MNCLIYNDTGNMKEILIATRLEMVGILLLPLIRYVGSGPRANVYYLFDAGGMDSPYDSHLQP